MSTFGGPHFLDHTTAPDTRRGGRGSRSRVTALAVLVGVATMVTTVAVPAAAAPAKPEAPAGAPFADDEVIVEFLPGTPARDRVAARASVGVLRREQLSPLAPNAEVLTLAKGRGVMSAVAALRSNPNVRFAEPNYLLTTSDSSTIDPSTIDPSAISNDPQFTGGSLWGMYGDASTPRNIYGSGAAEAWAADKIGSSDVYVAVIDEGAEFAHADLAANFWTNTGDPVNGVDDDGNGYIDDVHGWDFFNNDNTTYDGTGDDHGTHVSGTIGGVGGNGIGVAGVNWDVTLISAKFLGDTGGYTSDAIRAVDYVTDLKVRFGLNIVASSNSWGGGGFSQGLLDAINRGGDRGILFVAAAGNSSVDVDATAYYPANYQCTTTAAGLPRGWDCMLTVAAIDSAGSKASFSNWGLRNVDLGAPGVSVMSTLPGSTYGSYSGTSMATPHVSGAVAMCASIEPSLTALDIRTAILGSTAPTTSMSGLTVTGGRLDVGAMVLQCTRSSAPVNGGATSLTATATSSSAIRLDWVDGATNEAFFEVARATMPVAGSCADVTEANWALVSTIGAGSTSMTVGGLASSTAYCFRVRAGNTYDTGSGRSVSAWSNTASATTQTPPPAFVCGAVAYSWIDTAGATSLTMGDDTSADVAMPFSINFYGTSYSRVSVGSNGVLGFGSAVTAYSNVSIPTSSAPNGIVAPFWDDLNPGAGGTVSTKTSGSAPNRTFTITWLNVPHYSVIGSTLSFQVVIDEATGGFTMNYSDVLTGNSSYDRGLSATVGVESPDGLFGTQVSYGRASLADGTAIRCGLTATSAPAITTTSLPDAVAQNAYAATVVVQGGTAPYTWAVTSGSMPSGLSLSTTAGVISGSPTAAASTTLGIRVTDGLGRTATASLPLTVAAGVLITSGTLPTAGQNVPYSTTLAATGGTAPYSWSLNAGSTLPAGLSLSSSGVLSGTPTTIGTSSFSVSVIDSLSQQATRTLSLTVNGAPNVTTTSLSPGMVGVSMSRTLAATGGAAPLTWSLVSGSLPAGLTLSTGGVISGTPTTVEVQTFTVRVTDAGGLIDDQPLSLTIDPLFTVTTASLPNAAVNIAYSATVQATGGSGGYTWTASGLPSGLSINSATGEISGTPTAVATSSVTVTARDTALRTASRTLSLAVTAAPVITTTSLASITTVSSYSYTLAASGGANPRTWSLESGSLPTGGSLSASGVISGSAAAAGTYSFTVGITDAYGRFDDQALTLVIVAPMSVTTSSMPGAAVGTPYSTTLSASGGTEIYTWTSTTLPAGLTLTAATGVVAGTPTTAGTYSVTFTATDNGSPVRTASRTLSIVVVAPLQITTTSINSVTTGSLFSFTLAATGGSGTRTWSLTSGTLPAGVTLSSGGVLSGTASVAGSSPITVAVADASPTTDDQVLTLVVVDPVAITTSSLAPGTTGSPYTATIAATGGTGTYSWSATGLPSGLTIEASTGIISGTPVNAATSTVSITVTDNGTPIRSAARSLSLVVSAPVLITTTTVPAATAGLAYSTTLAASGGSGTRVWTVGSGSLPAGITLSSAGVLSGTTTVSGTFAITVVVTDGANRTDDQALSLVVNVRSVKSSSITISRTVSSKGTIATAVVTVVDQSGALVSSATVTGLWTVSGVTGSTTKSGTTTTNGTVSIASNAYKSITGRTITFCITSIARTGFVYDSTGQTCASIVA